MQRYYPCLTVLAATLSLSAAVQAATFEYYAETGFEYDSNLTVDELDQSSNKSDNALLLGAGAEVTGNPLEQLTLTAAYDLSTRRYQSNAAFDQDIHLLSLDASYQIGSLTLGASQHSSHARLDSEAFLNVHRSSLYLGKLIGDDLYVMASLIDGRKSFHGDDARDARIRGVGLDSFYFLNNGKTLLSAGLQRSKENASADVFDYQLLAGRARIRHHFDLYGQKSALQFGLRYETRDYDQRLTDMQGSGFPVFDQSAALSGSRTDKIRSLDLSWALDLTKRLRTEAKVERIDARSPVESADYSKTLVSLGLRASF